MDEILGRLIELVVNLDDTVAGMEGDLDQLLADAGVDNLETYAGLLAKACTLLTSLTEALENDDRLNTVMAVITDGNNRELTDQEAYAIFFEHAVAIIQLCPSGVVPQTLIDYVQAQLRETQTELQNEISSEKLSAGLADNEIYKQLSVAQKHICHVQNNLNQVVNTLTLRQLREVLTDTSMVLKDVIIVGVDVSVLITDITTLLALKSAYSIYTGARSLRRRLGGFVERVGQWFGRPD